MVTVSGDKKTEQKHRAWGGGGKPDTPVTQVLCKQVNEAPISLEKVPLTSLLSNEQRLI